MIYWFLIFSIWLPSLCSGTLHFLLLLVFRGRLLLLSFLLSWCGLLGYLCCSLFVLGTCICRLLQIPYLQVWLFFCVFCPAFFIMLLFAFPNSMWYLFVVWSSNFCGSFWDIDINTTSSTHNRQAILVLFSSISIPIGSYWMSLLISSISTPYSNIDSTPLCLMLSFIFISLVSPDIVAIFAVRFSLNIFVILQCLSFMPWWCITCLIASDHAMS